jgi:membrane associated rhomboid family serine protease
MGKLPVGTIGLGAAAVAAAFLPGWPVLEPQHPTVAGILLGHIDHLSLAHLLWSGSVCLLFSALLESLIGTRRYLVCLLASAFIVSLGIMMLAPKIASCRGLSGLAHAFVATWACNLIASKDQRTRLTGVVVLDVAVAKVAYEVVFGHLLWSPPLGGRPLPASHASGLFAGVVVALGLFGWARFCSGQIPRSV